MSTSVADPRFSKRGDINLPAGRQDTILPNFPKKMHEIERIWAHREGRASCAPLRSAYAHIEGKAPCALSSRNSYYRALIFQGNISQPIQKLQLTQCAGNVCSLLLISLWNLDSTSSCVRWIHLMRMSPFKSAEVEWGRSAVNGIGYAGQCVCNGSFTNDPIQLYYLHSHCSLWCRTFQQSELVSKLHNLIATHQM